MIKSVDSLKLINVTLEDVTEVKSFISCVKCM